MSPKAYTRYSTVKQNDNNSKAGQRSRIMNFSQTMELNLSEEDFFYEDAKSAYSSQADKRPVLMALKREMIESDDPIVIFDAESRMDRTGYSFILHFYRPLKEHFGDRLQIYTPRSQKPWNPTNEEVKFAFLFSRQESEMKSTRALSSLAHFFSIHKDKRPGCRRPFGYSQERGVLVPNEEGEVVSLIYYLNSWGMSLGKIATILNEAGIPTVGGKAWKTGTLEGILRNPVYRGTLSFKITKGPEKGEFMTKDAHTPLVDPITLYFSQKSTALQKEFGRLDTPFLFLNKVICSKCRSKLKAVNASSKKTKKNYVYRHYECPHCKFKIDSNELNNEYLPKVFDYIDDFVSGELIVEGSLEYLQEVNHQCEVNIANLSERIDILSSNGSTMKSQQDLEYKEILERVKKQQELEIEKYFELKEKTEYVISQIHNGDHILHFHQFTEDNASQTEIRLMILYFVDEIKVSPNGGSSISYHSNLLQDFEVVS